MESPLSPSSPSSPSSPRSSPVTPDPPVPWWRVGVMWLVVGGLAVVVVGSFALLSTAVRHADTVVPRTDMGAAAGGVASTRNAPAMQGRNHAATPASGPRY